MPLGIVIEFLKVLKIKNKEFYNLSKHNKKKIHKLAEQIAKLVEWQTQLGRFKRKEKKETGG